jgi:hypothetical protein
MTTPKTHCRPRETPPQAIRNRPKTAMKETMYFLFIDQHLAKICALPAEGAVLKRGGM